MEKICVAVRVRPPLKADDDSNLSNGSHWKVEDNRISLHRSLSGTGTPLPPALSYTFDHVFDQDCSNSTVYDLLTKNVIHSVVDGFNGTVFAYGQTSSGKTFTMNGRGDDPGIIHWSIKDIFAKIDMSTDREFLIRVSYMEIYNEEINDLFDVENQKLQIHESLERGIYVAGLREKIVNSAEQVLNLIEMGEVNRHFGETNMNVRSSRSHTIFRMVIESKGKDSNSNDYSSLDDAIRVSVLNLVDLAGSERIAKTGAGGVRLKEGKHINKSLMILGNVINKLSDGARQRGHIPYRDSKLTRILQPALGGNAKTSIICTVAPEEVHVEETKGTLQFASRAKRITNCVQVNEILTDTALLKRQKLEIEELRKKLEGSHAGLLEQEILKLRNDMLKYQLEHEKLAVELEKERRSHREREQFSTEQQMKTGNGNTSVTYSGSDRKLSTQGSESLREVSMDFCITPQQDDFSTPTFLPNRSAFVAKRSYHSSTHDFSPLPHEFGDVADEDTWFKLNNGFIADLDLIGTTPEKELHSIHSVQDNSMDNYKEEVHNLRRQLQQAIDEKNEIERQHKEQIALNKHLIEEISKFQKEAQEIPRKLSESLGNLKAINKDTFSSLQSFVADDKSPTAKFFTTTSEFLTCLMSTFEEHVSMAVDGFRCITPVENDEKLNGLASTSRKAPTSEDDTGKCNKYKDCTLEQQIASWKAELSGEINLIKERYRSLEQELAISNQNLEASKEKVHGLGKEFQLVLEQKDDLLLTVSDSSKKLALMTRQHEKILQELSCEIQRRKDLEEDIKQLSNLFSYRQRSLMLFHGELKSKLDHLRG